MKLFSQLQRLMIVGATLGLLIPQPAFSGDPSSSGPIRDVALQQGGVLRGEVRSPQGRVSAGKTVSIIADGQLVAKSLTETDGRFTVSGLQPGVYAVVVGSAPNVIRVWAEGTAPPAATSDLLLVEQQRYNQHQGKMWYMPARVLETVCE